MNVKINAGKRKCSFCSKEIIVDEYKLMWHNNCYFHNECYQKNFTESAEAEIQDKHNFLHYVEQIFDKEYIKTKFSMHFANLLKKGYTYQGIHATLMYYFGVLGKSIEPTYGIFIAHIYYEEARKYYHKPKWVISS